MLNEIHLGDCLDVMTQIPSGSVDMILCDLPYGTTECKWDTVIPFESLWSEYKRIIKPYGAVLLFGSQPFTSALVMSNPKWFKYEWIWEKNRPTGHGHAKNKPMKEHENVLVFSEGTTVHADQSDKRMPYYPQGLQTINEVKRRSKKEAADTMFAARPGHKEEYVRTETGYPRSILRFPTDMLGLHPTAKPVALCEYLIKTYTNPGEIVLDSCIGSGTTAIAALNTGRQFIGIERDPQYHLLAVERVENHRAATLPSWLLPR